MRTIKLVALFIIYNLTFNISYAQSPVDSVGSGCALDFNGINNYVDCGNILYLGNTDLVASISFWCKGSGSVISTERALPPVGDGSIYIDTNGAIGYYSDPGGSTSFHAISTTTIDTSKWNHIAVVIDGPSDTYTFYINGVKETITLAFTMVNPTPFTNIEIGRQRNYIWGTSFFNGQIDEVRIWNKALTQTEIQQNMCKKLTGTEASLVGYWRFDDCGSLTAIDATANGNNGTLN